MALNVPLVASDMKMWVRQAGGAINHMLNNPVASGGGGSVVWSDVTGKPSTYPPSTHTHDYYTLTSLPTLFDGTWASLSGKPASFPPSSHGHIIADVSGLQSALDGKQVAGSYEPAISAGTASQYWAGDKTWKPFPSSSDPWTWSKLASNTSNSTVTLATSTLSFTANANTTYFVQLIGAFQSAATTTGIAVALDIPSGSVAGQAYHPTSATAAGSNEQIADNATTGATTGVRAASTNVPIGGEWIVAVGATGGAVTLNFRSEVAGSAVTLQAGITALGCRVI